jgi:hypothetical protein
VDSTAYVTRTYSRLADVATRHSQVSSHPGYAVVTSHTTDIQPLPHDMDCPQVSLILRGRVQDSRYPGGRILTFLPHHRCIITESKLHKVNTETKPQLACHQLRLLWSLYRHLSISTPRFLKIGPYVMYCIRNGSDTICDVFALKKDG